MKLSATVLVCAILSTFMVVVKATSIPNCTDPNYTCPAVSCGPCGSFQNHCGCDECYICEGDPCYIYKGDPCQPGTKCVVEPPPGKLKINEKGKCTRT